MIQATLDYRSRLKKNIPLSSEESSNMPPLFGGGLNASQLSLQSGNKPSVLTDKGQATYKPPVNPKKPKGLDVALEAYEQAQGLGSVDRIQEAIRTQPIGQIRDSSTDDSRFIKGTKNSFKNLATSLKGVIPRLDLVSTSAVEKILGRDNAISLGNFLRYNPFGADIGRDFATIQNEALDQLDYLSTQTLPTEGVLENVRNFNVGGLAAATVDAITSLAATAIPSVASGGTLLASEMVGGSLYDYNKAKADSKGVDIKNLYEKGEADFTVPAFLGSVAFGLEKIGLKGIEQGIKGKLIGNGYKKALLLANDANKEGLTEFIQTGIDEANQVLGNGGNIEDASKAALDAMFSERGFEAYAKGALGGGLAVGAGRISNNLINKKDRQQAQVIEDENQAILADIASDDIPSNAKTPLIDKLADNAEKLSEIVNKETTSITELTEEGQALVSDIQSRIQATEEAIDNASEISKPILEEQVKELNKELDEAIKDNKEVEVAPQEEIITEDIEAPTEITETPIGDTERINEINDTLNRNEGELSNPDLDPEMREFIEIQNEQLTEELNTLQEGGQDAIQKQSTGEIFQRQPEEVGETGSERIRVEQGEQREEITEQSEIQEEVIPSQEAEEATETVQESISPDRIKEIQTKREAIKSTIKDKLKAQRSQLSSGFDPSLIKDFIDLGATYAEEGIVRAEDFIKRFREDYRDIGFDDTDITDDQIITEIFNKSYPNTFSSDPIENSALSENLTQTTLRNADVEKKRRDYGFDEPITRRGATNERLLSEAEKAIKDGYDVYDLMDKILNERKPISGKESVILAKFQATKEAQLIEVNRKVEEAKNQSSLSFENSVDERNKILDDLVKAYDASEISGTVASDALRARKVKVLQDYSLANMLIRTRKVNNNEQLTDEQIQKVTQQYQRLTEAENKLNQRIAELEAENADLRLKEETNRLKRETEAEQRKSRRAKTKESIKAERVDLFKQIKELAKKQSGTLSANPIPVEALPIIAKLVKNYVADGVVSIEQIVDSIHEELVDVYEGVTLRNVRDAISRYGYEDSKTKSDLQKEVEDLKKQAKIISRIEDLQAGIERVDPESERANEMSQRLSELKDQLDEYVKDSKALKAFKTRVEKQIKETQRRIKEGDFDKKPVKEVKLDEEAKKLRDAYRKIKFDFDVELKKEELNKRTKFQKIKDTAIEVFNIPRALMATADLSAPLRQGIIPTISNPVMASKAFAEMLRQWTSEQKSERWLNDLKDSPAYQLMEESGLYIADKSNPSVKAREEDYMTNLAEKLPLGTGWLVGASERAYTGYLNKMRADLFTRGVDVLENDGITFANNPKAYKALASYINAATGRGDLGATLDRAAPILNATFFSPRLMASRLQLLSNWFNPKFWRETPKSVRNMYFSDMAKFIAFGASVLALAGLDDDNEVELDPRSPDFGKIRRGDTRWDIWGGFQQYVRIFAQLLSGQKKSTASGRITELDGSNYNKETRLTQSWNFIRGKFAPVPSFFYNWIEGKNTLGQPFNFRVELKNMLFPLVMQGVHDSAKQDGWTFGLLATGLPSVFGVGVQTYGVNNFLEQGVDNKIIDLLIAKKAVAIEPTELSVKVYDISKGEDRKLTDTEFKKYYNNWVEYIKGNLSSNYEEYKKMSPEKFESKFRSLKSSATKFAKESITGVSETIRKINIDGEYYTLKPNVLKSRIRYDKEYKAENRDKVDVWVENFISEGMTPSRARIEALKRLDTEANKYSRKLLIEQYGDRLKQE